MTQAPNRNSPCRCGSGRKYKHCCLGRRPAPAAVLPHRADEPIRSSAGSAYDQALQYRVLGMMSEAAEACRAVLRQNPQHAGALRVLGDIASGSGNVTEAVELFTRAIRAEPHNPIAYGELGRFQIALKRPAEATAALRHALEIDPTLVSV